MSQQQPNPQKRTAETHIDLNVPIDTVWKALTDAGELTQWFPLAAAVKPGLGGSITNDFGGGAKFTAPIAIWEPNKHLRLLCCAPNTSEADIVRIDYFLDDRGGGVTRLRLVHYGFSKDAAWDEMYDGVNRGWDAALWTLKYFLETRPGAQRTVIYLSGKTTSATPDSWRRLFAAESLFPDALYSAKQCDRFAFALGAERMNGVVRRNVANKDFQLIVENMDGVLLRLQFDPARSGGCAATLTLSTYGFDTGRIKLIETTWAAAMERALGGKVDVVHV